MGNLFNTWYNGILTIICLVVIAQVLSGVISWSFRCGTVDGDPDKLAAVLCWSVSQICTGVSGLPQQ